MKIISTFQMLIPIYIFTETADYVSEKWSGIVKFLTARHNFWENVCLKYQIHIEFTYAISAG